MLLAVCSGCTVSVATRKSKIVGTYKLTSMTDYDGDDVSKKGIEAYLVVPNEGYGYYVYKDNTTDVTVRYAQITFHADEEKPRKYSHVEYKVDGDSQSYNCGSTGGALNHSTLGVKPNSRPIETYWKTISWSREDSAQDLSYVKKQLGTLPEPIPFGSAKLDGFYSYSNYNSDTQESEFYQEFTPEFVYAYIDVNIGRNKAIVHYMRKSDMASRTVEYDLSMSDGSVTIGEQTFVLDTTTGPIIKIPAQFTSAGGNVYDLTFDFSRYDRRAFDLQRNIDYAVEQYNESLGEAE